jgi:glycosyltransferase involved in cell wall biosynthesis
MRIRTSFLQWLPGAEKYYRYLLPLMPRAIEGLRMPTEVDLIVSFSHAVAKGIHPPPGVPHVCYCFTPMRYAWHLRDDYFGTQSAAEDGRRLSLMETVLDAGRNTVLDHVREWDRTASARVTHFIAISRTVRQRIQECYDRPSVVIYPPVDTDFYTPANQPRQDYYLCVSALVPYKRIDLAIAACNELGRKLVVIGDGPERDRLARLAGPTVELRGWLSNTEIREHLRSCRALIFPGQEDFGIVPLEAQGCGAPVIAFGRGGVTETVLPATAEQAGTGVFFSEQTAESLRQAILWLEEHPAQCSPGLAREQALKFNAPRFERELMAYLESVVAGGA